MPSGLKAMLMIGSVCPWMAPARWPVATSQRVIAWREKTVEASVLPSGENARALTASRFCRSLRVAQGRTGGDVPDRDRAVLRGRGEDPAIGAERETVAEDARIGLEGWPGRSPGGDVPDPDGGLTAAAGGQGLAVRAEGDPTVPTVAMVFDGETHRAGGDVPEPDRPVRAGGRQELAVGGKRQPPHRQRVTCEGADDLAGGGIPEGHDPIAARGKPGAVRVEGDRRDLLPGGQGADDLAGAGIPELDGSIVARRGQAVAVGAVDHTPDRFGMAGERPFPRAGQPVEVIPLEAAQVGLTRRGSGLVELAHDAGDVGVGPVALGQVELGGVSGMAGDILAPQRLIARGQRRQPVPDDAGESQQGEDHHGGGQSGDLRTAPRPLHHALDPRGRPGQDRPALDPSVQILGQVAVRRRSDPWAPFSGTSGRSSPGRDSPGACGRAGARARRG